jgi:hypothetical protein
LDVVSVSPSTALPPIAGAEVLTGGSVSVEPDALPGATGAVVVLPVASVAGAAVVGAAAILIGANVTGLAGLGAPVT